MLRREEITRRLARVCLVAFGFDGVLTDNKVYVAQDGQESVRCRDVLGPRKLLGAPSRW